MKANWANKESTLKSIMESLRKRIIQRKAIGVCGKKEKWVMQGGQDVLKVV